MATSYHMEYDCFYDGGETILKNLCVITNGEVFEDVLSLCNVEMDEIRILYDPVVPFAIICAVMLLADIAIRKLRWKDVVEQLIKLGILKPKV